MPAGRELPGQGHWAEAGAAFEQGLDLLADAYYFSGLLDATGPKPALAEMLAREGKLESAAAVNGRMLEVRLGLFRQKRRFAARASP